jgi:ferredoxin/flavodoxin---NADP+ reductase
MSSAFGTETVLDVRHWTDAYFSFTTTRDDGFRFDNGQFVMIGLEVDGRPLLRAYSIASANWEEQLEFLSIKVPQGALTSRLSDIRPGDTVLVGRKPTGTLLIHDLLPGRILYLLGTGTGFAPWLSIVKDPDTYERFERVILCHGVRRGQDLVYRDYVIN